MQRRRSHNHQKYPGVPNDDTERKGSKSSHKKHSSFFCSASNILAGCLITCLLYISIQTRSYSATFHGQEEPTASVLSQHRDTGRPVLLPPPPIKKTNAPKIITTTTTTTKLPQTQFTQIEEGSPHTKSADNTNVKKLDEIVLQSQQQQSADNEKGSPDTKSTVKNNAADDDGGPNNPNRQLYPPRVFHYNFIPSDETEEALRRGHVRLSKLLLMNDNVEDEPDYEPKVTEVALKEEPPNTDNSDPIIIDGNSSALDMDDEDGGEAALEDKNAEFIREDEEAAVEECVPMAKWQSSVPVNCNMLHEIDMTSSIVNAQGRTKSKSKHSKKGRNNDTGIISQSIHHEKVRHPSWNETQLKFLGQGWFRAAWKLDRQPATAVQQQQQHHSGDENWEKNGGETFVLKMLRPERDFTEEFYELHRIDAVAMERLSHSKFVLDVYGYCGQSAINEFANFRVPELSSLEKFDRQLRGKNFPRVNQMKLKLAIGVATGIAHIHEVPADLVTSQGATMAHYDLNPRNVAIVAGGMPKLNDFNVAHFLKINPRTNQTCGFPSRLHEPWWRAPEEVSVNDTTMLTEAVDVWSLGNLLFHILTSHSPRGKMKDFRMESVRQEVLQGIPPPLPTEFATSKDPAVEAFRHAMQMCFAKDPEDRPTAREVADHLMESYYVITKAERDKEKKEKKKKGK